MLRLTKIKARCTFQQPAFKWRQRGFTLIELLVSIAIMALISIGAFSFLSSTSQSSQTLNAHQQRLLTLERMQGVIANDLAQWVNRPIRDEQGDSLPAFVLDTSGALEFSRRGLSNPLDKTRSDLLRVRYEMRGTQFWRLTWATLDRIPGQQPFAAPLGPRGLQVQWRVQASPQARIERVWPSINSGATGQSQTVLTQGAPEVVELQLHIAPWGDIRRLYWMPGNDTQ